MLKTLVVTASVAAGLLMLDVAQPVLTGSSAEAAPPRRNVVVHPPPPRMVRPAPRAVVRAKPNFARPHSTFTRRFKPAPKFTPRVTHQQFQKKSFTPQMKKGFNPNVNAFKKVGAGPGLHAGWKNGPGFGKKFGPGAAKASFIKVANKSWPIHRGPHRLWWRNGWRTFVPFSALGVVLIGGSYYWPDAYISVARPYCTGITPDGCELNWQQVGFEGGGSEWQCVQYCQRPGVPPPPRAAALVVAPPAPAGGRCELEIFAEANFAGLNAQSTTDQPKLDESGWKNEISSVQVKAGTWDFFTDDDFAGENMRLVPGPYPDLGPQWSKRVGSFMCVEGG